jgi:cold shock CspA family protein
MYRSGLVDTLVTHANTKGFGLTFLSRDLRGFMPPKLKTKQLFVHFLNVSPKDLRTLEKMFCTGWKKDTCFQNIFLELPFLL